MSATVPGGPKTSYVSCLGSKGLASLILVSAYEGRFWEPKTPCSRHTVNPPALTTTRMISNTHSRLRSRKIANPLHRFRPRRVHPLEHASAHRPRHARGGVSNAVGVPD